MKNKNILKIEISILFILFVVSIIICGILNSYNDNIVVIEFKSKEITKTTIPEITETIPETVIETTVPETIPETTISEPTVPETTETETFVPKTKYIGKFVLTAYCPCSKCCGTYALNRPKDENGNDIVYTASGERAKSNYTIAVDPNTIPYGTEVIINGHTYKAQDCGGAVKGKHIDIYFDNHQDALNFGRQESYVYLINEEK